MMASLRAPAGCSLALPSSWQRLSREPSCLDSHLRLPECLLPALPVPLVLFPRPNPPPGGDIDHITGPAPFAPWRPRPILLSHTRWWTTDQNKVTGPQGHWLHIWGNRGPETAWFHICPGLSHPWESASPRMGVKEGWGSQMPGSHLGMWPPNMGCLCTHKISG